VKHISRARKDTAPRYVATCREREREPSTSHRRHEPPQIAPSKTMFPASPPSCGHIGVDGFSVLLSMVRHPEPKSFPSIQGFGAHKQTRALLSFPRTTEHPIESFPRLRLGPKSWSRNGFTPLELRESHFLSVWFRKLSVPSAIMSWDGRL
jgi:hypothetical protein